MGKKNVRKDIKEFRQKLGFKTRDLLMGNIEDYCKSNKEIKKIINEKTIQRMENDFFASDHTLKIYSAVLKVEVDQLLEESQKNSIFKSENEFLSTSSSYVKRILNHKDLIEITQNCSKRKFIMDFNEDNLVYGQNEGVKHAIEFIDKSTLATKADLTTLIKDDDFGNQEKNKVNKDFQVCLNETIKGLEKGSEWISWEEVENLTAGSFNTRTPETDAEKMMKWIPKVSKNKYQIFTHGAKIFFDTFWPFEEFYFKKNIISKGVFSNEIFDPKKEKGINASGEIIYDPHGINNYILVPVRLYYSIIIFSSRPSIDSINIKNSVGNKIASDLMNEGNEKILYKKFNSTFNQVINDLSNRDIYPKNYLDETDINIIYAKDKFMYDPDDYLYTIDESSEKCRDEILSDNKFNNLVKFLNKGLSFKRKFNTEDNLDYNSRKKWLEKYNEFDFLLEDIKQIFGYYWDGHEGKEINETIEKVKNIFLEAGDNLSKELKKTAPITELP